MTEQPRDIAVVRCYCPDCQYAVSAMTLAALADALNMHRVYMR